MQLSLLLLVISPLLAFATTQSGAGPHIGAVAGRTPSIALRRAVRSTRHQAQVYRRQAAVIAATTTTDVEDDSCDAQSSTSVAAPSATAVVNIQANVISPSNSALDGASMIGSAVAAVVAALASQLGSAEGLISHSPVSSPSSSAENFVLLASIQPVVPLSRFVTSASSTPTTTPSTPTTTPSTPTSSPAASPTSTGSGQVYTNSHATYYYQNGVAGNCGTVNPDTALIVALTTSMYANGVNCGRTVLITRVSTGAQVTAIVADSCPTCDTSTSLDLSKSAFNAIAATDEGEVDITWQYMS